MPVAAAWCSTASSTGAVLIVAIIAHENPDLNPDATSPAGALGIMQVMPQWLGAFRAECGADLHAVETNVCFGVRVLQEHVNDAGGSLTAGLRRYVGCSSTGACARYPGRVLKRWEASKAAD